MDNDTYILDDSGLGFWNPDDPATWELIQEAWNLHIPDDCAECQSGTVLTWLFEVYMHYDPQLRIGMFSSYQDVVISQWFLNMGGSAFESLALDVTGQIKSAYPDSFARFFINGRSHTILFLPQGPNYAVNGISLYDWVGALVSDDSKWDDELE